MAKSKSAPKQVLLPPVRFDSGGLTRCRVCGGTYTEPCPIPCAWANDPLGRYDICGIPVVLPSTHSAVVPIVGVGPTSKGDRPW